MKVKALAPYRVGRGGQDGRGPVATTDHHPQLKVSEGSGCGAKVGEPFLEVGEGADTEGEGGYPNNLAQSQVQGGKEVAIEFDTAGAPCLSFGQGHRISHQGEGWVGWGLGRKGGSTESREGTEEVRQNVGEAGVEDGDSVVVLGSRDESRVNETGGQKATQRPDWYEHPVSEVDKGREGPHQAVTSARSVKVRREAQEPASVAYPRPRWARGGGG